MATTSVTLRQHAVASASEPNAGRRWNGQLFHLLAAAGALAVIIGSYMTWATFYAGLIERDGVSGHGKYFIALAAGAALAAIVSSKRGLAPVRVLVPLAGVTIAAFAVRDLSNLHDLIGNRAAALYVPDDGPGLYVVIAGALLLAASFIAAPRISGWRATNVALAAIAGAAVIGLTLSIAGAYGEYYLHFASSGHAQNHAEAIQPAHLLSFGGGALLVASFSALLFRYGASRRPTIHRR